MGASVTGTLFGIFLGMVISAIVGGAIGGIVGGIHRGVFASISKKSFLNTEQKASIWPREKQLTEKVEVNKHPHKNP